MATNKLTTLALRTIKPGPKVYKMSDGDGLFLQVPPSGTPRWQLAYRFNRKPKTLSFGTFPLTSLAAARKKRDDARALLAKGLDPISTYRVNKADVSSLPPDTFEAVGRAWYNSKLNSWSERYANDTLKIMERDLFPHLGTHLIGFIEAPALLKVLRKVEHRGAHTMAGKARSHAGRIFRHGIGLGHCERNPSADLIDVMITPPKVQHHKKLSAAELPNFFIQLGAYDGSPQTTLGMEMLLRTMVRTSEARWAPKNEFENLDGKAPVWRIPGQRMKKGLEHLVPLTPQVVPIVKRLMALSNNEWLLPQLNPSKSKGQVNPVVSENTFLYALYRMGYHSRATVHGFRSTASTILNEQEFNPDWIELQLAHVDKNKIRGTYNSAQWITGRRSMLVWWNDYLDKQRAAAELVG